ncbi:Fe3+-hydroxamate ABC transporter periplasmic protein [Halovivax asiaticus JCM 14624]|uniref:Fe3+-hydroxamate ABC transporter periplasmic protein n=1 Tax=Halovivax asiaticus JCM 14624 TaxID=1227490 RepID=M0BFI6_9EURY|nr:ABC transporter substrate-binding protein [Halovivax asiaticus]ELZ09237.1 Fe3+-hydroxamate ABC transporter periplasmic protein [Halovivax asiaticus JCM 14624]
MSEARRSDRTRRRFIGTGIAAGSAALAGCLSGDGGILNGGEGNGRNGSHTVTMSPVGEVAFDGVPEDAFVTFPHYADMAVALGHGDAVNTLFAPEMSGPTMSGYYDQLDGVSFDGASLPHPLDSQLTEEQLFAYESDVHFLDPSYVLLTQRNWSQNDIENVSERIGPWFGNFHSGVHSDPADAYAGTYEYYTLWELFEKVAAVFQEEERYAELAELYEETRTKIRSNLPPKADRPTVARATLGDGVFYSYHLDTPGFWQAETRPLGANDAFADESWSDDWGTIGYEAMLDADPDVLLHLWGITPQYSVTDARERLEADPIGRQLSAVQNDRVVASGMRYQGPIMNLFQLEMTAKQLYPEQFGEWPGYRSGESYPDIPAAERLFDRQRLAKIITA